MIKRTYFMSARCSEGDGFCFNSVTSSYRSWFPDIDKVYNDSSESLKVELKKVRPNGGFEIICFSRLN